MRRAQNFSYIYRKTNLNGLKAYITMLDRAFTIPSYKHGANQEMAAPSDGACSK